MKIPYINVNLYLTSFAQVLTPIFCLMIIVYILIIVSINQYMFSTVVLIRLIKLLGQRRAE